MLNPSSHLCAAYSCASGHGDYLCGGIVGMAGVIWTCPAMQWWLGFAFFEADGWVPIPIAMAMSLQPALPDWAVFRPIWLLRMAVCR